MEGSLLAQGLNLMLVGMGTVFSFLTVLVLATRAMSALVLRLQPAPASVVPARSDSVRVDEREIVAVIAAAITRHRAPLRDSAPSALRQSRKRGHPEGTNP